jgi:F0F1-type ATP synthase assembly protein I
MADKGRLPGWVRYSGVGVELAGAVAVFALVGYWIDGHYGSRPWGMLVGLVLGLTGGLYNLVKQSLQAGREARIEDGTGQSRPADSEASADKR